MRRQLQVIESSEYDEKHVVKHFLGCIPFAHYTSILQLEQEDKQAVYIGEGEEVKSFYSFVSINSLKD